MKKATLLTLLTLFLFNLKSFSQNSVWTKQYEQRLYNQWDAEAKQRLSNDSLRKDFVSYMVKRFKQELPNGLESVTRDSIERLAVKIGKERWNTPGNTQITNELKPNVRPWSKLIEDALKEGLMKNLPAEDKPKGKFLCDCAVLELKKMYPNGLVIPIPKESLQKASDTCYQKLNEVKVKP